jgi:integrase
MAWVSAKPLHSGKYRGGYVNRDGKRITFMGTFKKSTTLEAARAFEAEEREIRLKLRAAPGPEVKHATRPIDDVLKEYIAYGRSQGGKRGTPWSFDHARKRESQLHWWMTRLHVTVLGDLAADDILGRAQQIVQKELQSHGRSGRTCSSYRESIVVFCSWAAKRKYLAAHPLEAWPEYNKTPLMKRRALTLEEIGRLLSVAPEERRLLYEVAISTGLRANELRSLRICNLDIQAKGLHLQADWTKNRREDFQPLSHSLLQQLAETTVGKPLTAPLLNVFTNIDRTFKRDRENAGIPADAFGGRADFHALRHTAITLAGESGATVKEMQTFARHSDPRLTMNTYARVREDRQSELAERLGEVIDLAKKDVSIFEQRATMVHAQAVGAELAGRIALTHQEIRYHHVPREEGFESPPLRQC